MYFHTFALVESWGPPCLDAEHKISQIVHRVADLLLQQLKGAISELLRERGLNGSVQIKVNHRGEQVIAAILNEQCPHCGGTGKKKYPPDEDEPQEGRSIVAASTT